MTWNRPGWPGKEDRSYHVLIARIRDLAMLLQVQIDERTTDISLNEYAALTNESLLLTLGNPETLDFFVVDSIVAERDGRRILVVTYRLLGQRALTIVFKDKGRFIAFSFSTLETLFESKQDEFWAVVDSYEYLE
ncbi:MAG: hypothetical protein ACE5JN_08175 [Candidatus Methylomirabilia bacterium]